MRFFFHVNNGAGWTYDREGLDLDGIPEALEKAVDGARGLMAEEIVSGQSIDLSNYIAIDDESGREVARVLFQEAVTFVGK